jgi:hypothetical protein
MRWNMKEKNVKGNKEEYFNKGTRDDEEEE